jgi:type IV secretory pathway VirB3-like protein
MANSGFFRKNPCTPFGPPPQTGILAFWDGTDTCHMWTTPAKAANVTTNGQEFQMWEDKTVNSYDAISADLNVNRSPLYLTGGINSGRSVDFTLPGPALGTTRSYNATGIVNTGVVIAMVYYLTTNPALKVISYPLGNVFNGVTFKDQGIFAGGSAVSNRLGIRIRNASILTAQSSVTAAINTTYVHICYKSGGNLIQRVNGSQVYNTATAIPLDVNGISIGRRGDLLFQTDMIVGDVLIYDDTISGTDILDIENYLIAKYT